MKYEIIWDNKALNELEKLEHIIKKRIVNKIENFSEDISFHNIRKIKGNEVFRLRVGDYRVLIDIENEIRILKVVSVGHRKNIYKR